MPDGVATKYNTSEDTKRKKDGNSKELRHIKYINYFTI